MMALPGPAELRCHLAAVDTEHFVLIAVEVMNGEFIDLFIYHDKPSLIPGPSPGGRREFSSLSLRERGRG
jgi:hypothetical protein